MRHQPAPDLEPIQLVQFVVRFDRSELSTPE
jgi:hypothetical protein